MQFFPFNFDSGIFSHNLNLTVGYGSDEGHLVLSDIFQFRHIRGGDDLRNFLISISAAHTVVKGQNLVLNRQETLKSS